MTYLQNNPPARSQFRMPRRATPTGGIVVHTAENGGAGIVGSAKAVARFIQRRTDAAGSYHAIVDESEWIQLVPYEAEAFGEGSGGNRWALHLSFACRTTDWATMPDDRRKRLLDMGAQAAAAMARWCRDSFGIVVPGRVIMDTLGYRAGQPGFISHAAIDPARRTDPGKDFPWVLFIKAFNREMETTPDMTDTEKPYAAQVNEALQLLTEHAGYTGAIDGLFGPKALEALHRLKNDRERLEDVVKSLREASQDILSILDSAE